MALDAATAQELIKKLVEDREQYIESVNRTHALLIQAIAAAGGAPEPQLTTEIIRRNARTPSLDVESILNKSIRTGDFETSDTEDNESLYVQDPLKAEVYDEVGLRAHLLKYPWTKPGIACLDGVPGNRQLLARKGTIFPETASEAEADLSDHTHYSVFDVFSDGAPIPVRSLADDAAPTRSVALWNKLRTLNADPNKSKQAVGRIVIVREPSPLLFGAIHYVMHKHFDVDELYEFLVDDGPEIAHPHRAFATDRRHRRAFHWTFEYFTIIGDGRTPMTWQLADADAQKAEKTHIPISRCSSVVALSLEGNPMSKVRNRDRNAKEKIGDVFDPFAPWRVLSVQCYPDWKSDTESHDSTKHYVNGPEAFLVTLKAEYRDARKRLREVYEAISDLVEPPTDFMFHQSTRDRMLFEDDQFTYSRRYHWAYHSLGIMNQDIEEMVTAYRDAFKESTWNGTNKIIWPGDSNTSSRYAHWRKRMVAIRADFDREVAGLEHIKALNERKMKSITGLRENLFSGTSVLESRKSVDNSYITVNQGRNIKLLTLVTIFFLPLTFVTSVFGMTNMPPNDNFYHFAWATIAICIPTYLLIGSLNSTAGLEFWRRWTHRFFTGAGRLLARTMRVCGYVPLWAEHYFEEEEEEEDEAKPRAIRKRNSLTALEGLASRATFREDAYALQQKRSPAMANGGSSPSSPPPGRPGAGRTDSFNRPPTRSSTIQFQQGIDYGHQRTKSGRPVSELPEETKEMALSEAAGLADLEKGPFDEHENALGANEDAESGSTPRKSGSLFSRRKTRK